MSDEEPQAESNSTRYRFKKGTPEQAAVKWRKGTIDEHLPSGLRTYENDLGFNREDLRGKDVLDLGTDNGDSLAKELHEAGIHTNIVSLSPDFATEGVRKAMSNYYSPGWKMKKGVAGIAQQLPFKDNVFDIILSDTAVTYAASTSPYQVQAWVAEIGRVLKVDGEARLGPLYNLAYGKKNENLIQSAQKAGLDIEINESYILLRKIKHE